MAPFDYRATRIMQRGFIVRALQVVGIAVELLLTVAQKKGINTVGVEDVPVAVELYEVEVFGRRKASVEVNLTLDDRRLALKVGIEVRQVLLSHGLNVNLVMARAGSSGTHDLICDAPFRALTTGHAPGLFSGELKLRSIRTDRGRATFRTQMRKDALKIFNAVAGKPRQQWAGRFVLLVEFGAGTPVDWKVVRCDLYLHETKEWHGLFGWAGATSFDSLRPPQEPLAAPSQKHREAFDVLLKKLEDECVEINGRSMWEVKAVLKQFGSAKAARAMPTIGGRWPVWRRKRKWSEGDCARRPRKRGNAGGVLLFWAAEPVMWDLYQDMVLLN